MNLFGKGAFGKRRKKRKIGLALASGGAKGMAHLGALKAFDEAGFRFDCYAGASIGSIVGALCAYGFHPDEMKEIVQNICLRQYLRYVRPYMDMTFIEELLNEYLCGVNFESLPRPFYAWATETGSREGVLLQTGSVARACTASSAVPPYFHSVNIDGRELIDGAYTNPMPADVLRERGADFVIGVDLNVSARGETPVHYYNRLTKFISLALDSTVAAEIKVAKGAKARGYAACDVVIKPKLASFSTLDAARDSLQKMYDAGYAAAKERLSEILEKLNA